MSHYIKCEFCGESIDGRYDDNYNTAHTQICCPECFTWNWVYEEDVIAKRNSLVITGLNEEQREAVIRIVEQLGGKVENE